MASGQVLAGDQEGLKHRLHKQIFLHASIPRCEHDSIYGSIFILMYTLRCKLSLQ